MHLSLFILVSSVDLYKICTTAKYQPFTSVSKSIEAFNIDFFKAVAFYNIENNFICSSVSAYTILSMTAYGSNGNTFTEYQKSLYLPKEKKFGLDGLQKLIKHISNNKRTVTLKLINRICTTNGTCIKKDYEKLIQTYFFTDVCSIDVINPYKSADIINYWVKNNTEYKINNIIEAGDITENTNMILLNGIYFKGTWKHSFMKQSTESRIFYVNENYIKNVSTMYNYEEYVTGELEDLKVKFIELPYKNSDLSMIIILPNKIDGLKHVINNFGFFNMSRFAKAGIRKKTFVYLPKFKIESSIQLIEPLRKLGLNEMFTDKANFSEIAANPLLVTRVIQKAFIDVNEEGTEATTLTVSMMLPYAYNPEPTIIAIDKPFIFKIYDKRTQMTLFVGAVTDPKDY